ncbi:LysR family transcriptional regulator [Pelagibius sp. Alg239-R121]|uniref:LysR family transcriptional regulator n=1 Tax=Pelagibius sp. Alg239-R121 TaxID=2993448 RepID=UPI0024A6FC7C|nr:LysR family transcriptional regulator [Pelagibius sp. Alg239-R121]
MSEWDDYRFALALQRSGSVRGAAQILGVNHATVSRRLAGLNERLGAPAFVRLDGVYKPTSLGGSLVAAALRMEDAVYAAEREAMGREQGMSGVLTLSLPDVLARHLLMEDIGRFQETYPAIKLTLQTSHGFADLDRREADLVVRITNEPPDHLVGRRLFKYARCGYAAPDYIETHASKSLRWLGWPDDSECPDWVRGSPYPEVPVGLRIEDPLVRHAAALAGQGLIFEACLLADPEEGLIRLPGARPEPDRDIWVLTHPDLKDTPRVSTLMRHLADAIIRKRDLIEGRAG